ncbi:MAG: hypothetical protein AB1725_10405, partial [Armatimonadota bacterium]
MVRLLSIALSAALFFSSTAAGLHEGVRVVSAVTHFTDAHVKDALDKQWTLGYDPNGYLNSITNPENETVSAVYDSLGRIK